MRPDELEALKAEAMKFIYEKIISKEADHPEAVKMYIDSLASRGLLTGRTEAKAEGDMVLTEYDAGLLNDYGDGDVDWWHDYIRVELARAYDFYQSQISAAPPVQQGEKS